MKIHFISGDDIVLTATEGELKSLQEDDKYKPNIGDEINVSSFKDDWKLLKANKQELIHLGNLLLNLGNRA